ncbi:Na(+)/glucose symporter [Limihaloglobus sulfuriphilus]|uniref:Na(+)/glucose symporter n=1 Tax=Limihaloglobus sulfuriphilus TaxID=1851148 RepID=A0A1Q2MII9_9BACT|nr:hypothetical protein [Limihaloglobus sulfuriphilus]AQQ72072.1 Na(+)/glucose symporter [Limihaloglobus sulfuriphilus]
MTAIDTIIIAAYFVVVMGLGLYYQRSSAASLDSYFLGNKDIPWYLLAFSGSATNFSVCGTVWQISVLFFLGMKSFYIHLAWGSVIPAFWMAYAAIWIRRSRVMTAAELVQLRFGPGSGSRCARTSYALLGVLGAAGIIGMAFVVLAEFSKVYGLPPVKTATAITLLTSAYVLLGGFKGVIITDFIQSILLALSGIVMAVIAYRVVDPQILAENIGNIDDWLSLGIPEKTNVPEYENFRSITLSRMFIGTMLCFTVTAGGFGEQRFLAAKSTAEAAKISAFWNIVLIPRWLFTAAIAFLGLYAFSDINRDQVDQLLPMVLNKYLTTGIRGLVVVSLVAAFMSTISSLINSGASMMMRDIIQPLLKTGDGEKRLVWLSYLSTAIIIAAGLAIGIISCSYSTLNSLWSWIMAGLGASVIFPNVLRWYWWRVNGWGFMTGFFSGLVVALLMLIPNFPLSDNAMSILCVLVSGAGCVIGSLLTEPVKEDYINEFYKRVRPFGFWKKVYKRLGMSEQDHKKRSDNPYLVFFNAIIAGIALHAYYMCSIYVVGHFFKETLISLAVAAVTSIVLYFTWYRMTILKEQESKEE